MRAGLKYGLDIYAPVDDAGRFVPEVEFFGGQFVFDANAAVNKKLPKAGALLKERGDYPFLSPLLALQKAGHVSRHRAVVHFHGKK